MKPIPIKLSVLCALGMLFVIACKSYAAGLPVVDATVAAAVNTLQGTTIFNEMARASDAAAQIDHALAQISRLEQLHCDAMKQYDELMAMTTWQGAWDKLGGMKMETPGSLSDALEMYRYNKRTIENVMLDNPVENVLNNIEGLEGYIPEIDTEYWTEKTDIPLNQMFKADAVAMMLKKDYDEHMDKLYGYEDENGKVIGQIPALMERWETYHDTNFVNIQNAAEKAKAQAYLDSLTAQMDSLKKEEQVKKDRYEAALAFCKHVKDVRSKVADVRAKYRAGIINSKLQTLNNEDIVEKLKKEEAAALSF